MKLWIGGALLLAVLALVTRIGASRAELEFPPIGDFIQIDGLQMHYREEGSGPAIVLIHGASTNLRDLHTSIFAPLSRRHRVIAIDRPGHGYSERPDGDWPDPAEQARLIHKLLRKLDVHSPLLVGHSWSGSVVLAYLLDYPQEAAGGVLLAGGSHPWRGGVAWYNELAGAPVIGELFARTVAYPLGWLALDEAVRQVFDPNPVPTDYRQRTGVLLSLRPNAFLANAADISKLSEFLQIQSRRYAEIEHPLLVFTGTADDIVPAWNHADRLMQQVKNAERIDFKDTGHALHHVHANQIAEAIAAFAAKMRPPNGVELPF